MRADMNAPLVAVGRTYTVALPHRSTDRAGLELAGPVPQPTYHPPMPEQQRAAVELDQVVEAARAGGDQWREFLRAGMFSAGIYRLSAGEVDRQTPHAEDEIYYALAGRAELEVEGERQAIGPGSLAFVAKLAEHRFVDIVEDLELLVIFAPPETEL
jgi:mannose-6-phosphate isomerase-like protein (cupin superfamily)